LLLDSFVGLLIAVVNCTPSANGAFSIATQSALNQLAACITVLGGIYIRNSAETTIDFPPSIETLQGQPSIQDCRALKFISAPRLVKVAQGIRLSNCSQLESLYTPSLTTVASIDFSWVPALNIWIAGLVRITSDLQLYDTQLRTLPPLEIKSVQELIISKHLTLGFY